MNVLKIKEKYHKIPLAARASVWYTICNILQRGISFIVVPIYTRVLSTTEYGQYSVFQSWCNILIIFATLNLYCGVFTKAMVDYSDDRDKYTSSIQTLSTVITLLIFTVYIFGVGFWNNIFEMSSITMILMFSYFLFYPAITFWSVRQRVEYKYRSMILVTLLVSVATPLFSLFLLFKTSLRAEAVIWGFLIIQSVAGFVFYIYNLFKGRKLFIKKYWINALEFNIPLIPHYLSLIVLGQADRIMIDKYCGSDKTAIYNLAYQVSMIMNLFIVAINNSLVPWSYEKLKQKDFINIRRVSNGLCIIIVIMSFGAILIAPEIIAILGTSEYLEAIWVIPSVSISVYFTFCYGLFSNVEFYYSATKYVMVASMTGAVLNVILNALFIPKYGFIAAGYTTLFCYLVFMIMHYIFMKTICKQKTQNESVYDIGFITLSCLGICLIGIVSMLLYKNEVVRYIVILIGTFLCFAFRKKLVCVVKEIRK